jgi:hypothetical protein
MKELRHDWTLAEVEALFALPFNDLLFSFRVNACAGVNIPKVTQVSIPIAFTP